MRRAARLACVALLALLAATSAYAQTAITGRVSNNCPSTSVFSIGTQQFVTVDQAGRMCTSGSGGGGGGGTVTQGSPNSGGSQGWFVQLLDGIGNAITSTTVSAKQALDINVTNTSLAVTQSTASSLNATVVGAGTAGTPVGGVSSVQGVPGGTAVPVSNASLPLPSNAAQETGGNLATVAGAVSGSVVQSNTKQVNGVTTLAGAGAVGTGAQRIAVGQDTTTVAGAAPTTTGIYVTGPSAAALATAANQTTANSSLGTIATNTTNAGTPTLQSGSTTAVTSSTASNLNATVVGTGTFATQSAVTAASGSIAAGAMVDVGTGASPAANTVNSNLKTINTTLGSPLQAGGALAANQSVNTAQVNGVTTSTGAGATGTGSQRVTVAQDTSTIAGSAPGTAAGSNPASAGTPSLNVLTTQEINGSAYANKANFVSGSNSATGTAATTIIAAPTNGKLYITSLQCFRTDAGTSAVTATLNDTATTVVGLANLSGGGGNNIVFSTPLVIAATTASKFTMSSGVTTAYCSEQGYNAP